MRAVIHSYRVCEVLYFNCVECGAPIFTEQERELGWCLPTGGGCSLKGKPKKMKVREARQAFLERNYDPYGQPMAGER